MRCPKCGYISFDHLETCLKCKKNIKAASDTLQGTVYNVAAPAFLKFEMQEQEPEGMDEMAAFVVDGDGVDDGEIQDPDLDILLEEKAEDDDAGVAFTPDEEEEEGFSLALDDNEGPGLAFAEDENEEGGISLDLGGMDEEDADEPLAAFSGLDEDDEEPAGDFALDLPEELNDMSDLEPPAETAGEDDDFDLNLDLDLDLDSDDFSSPAGNGGGPIAGKGGLDDDLDLGDLDFDEAPKATAAAEKKGKTPRLNLDEELNFDLDLGDLTFDDK